MEDLKVVFGKKVTKLRFSAEDFSNYCLMIGLSVSLVLVSFQGFRVFQISTSLMLCALIPLFAVRNGARIGWPSLLNPQSLVEVVCHLYRIVHWRLLVYVAIFVCERLVREVDSGRFTDVFSFGMCLTIQLQLYVLALFRCAALAFHIREAKKVEQVMRSSSWRHFLNLNCSINIHIVHAALTGWCSQMMTVAPFFLLASWKRPIWSFVVLFCMENFLSISFIDDTKMFYAVHYREHHSSGLFTLFHGSHHDAIPSGLLSGGTEVGFVEGFCQGLLHCHPLKCPTSLWDVGINFYKNILYHHYIPGVFPYSQLIVAEEVHHVVHHYMHLVPYVGFPGKVGHQIDIDIDNYNPENPTWTWFCDLQKSEERPWLWVVTTFDIFLGRRVQQVATGFFCIIFVLC
jgi:hypothetical protein